MGHIWLLFSYEGCQPVLRWGRSFLLIQLPSFHQLHQLPSFQFSRAFSYFDSGHRHCLLIHCRWGLVVFTLLCLIEDPISLPSTFSDAAQFAHLVRILLHFPAQLLQEGLQGWETSPPASGTGSWHLLKSGTWRSAVTPCGSLCSSRDSCFYTFWGKCPVTSMSKTAAAPQFEWRPPYFTPSSHPAAQPHGSVGCSQGRSLPTPVKGLLTLPNQRELHQRLQECWNQGQPANSPGIKMGWNRCMRLFQGKEKKSLHVKAGALG